MSHSKKNFEFLMTSEYTADAFTGRAPFFGFSVRLPAELGRGAKVAFNVPNQEWSDVLGRAWRI